MIQDYLAIGIDDSDGIVVWSEDFRTTSLNASRTTEGMRQAAINILTAKENAPKPSRILIVSSGAYGEDAPSVVDDFNVDDDGKSPAKEKVPT